MASELERLIKEDVGPTVEVLLKPYSPQEDMPGYPWFRCAGLLNAACK